MEPLGRHRKCHFWEWSWRSCTHPADPQGMGSNPPPHPVEQPGGTHLCRYPIIHPSLQQLFPRAGVDGETEAQKLAVMEKCNGRKENEAHGGS